MGEWGERRKGERGASIFVAMFEKNLQDLVKGIRSHRKTEAEYIARAMDDIRKEISDVDMKKKYNAVQKLTYVRGCWCV